MSDEVCVHCGVSADNTGLLRCPMCHKYTCSSCQYTRGGKVFCHMGCADEFFFGGDDDEEEED